MTVTDYEVTFPHGDGDAPEAAEILRNVRTILRTPKGSCPLYRDFGVDMSGLDRPMDVAKNLLTVAIMEAVEKYEPRVKVSSVDFAANPESGGLTVKAVIRRE